MAAKNCYYLMTFENTHAVLQAEEVLKQHFDAAIMPVPRELTAGCGLAVRFLTAGEAEICSYMEKYPMNCRFYEMETEKIDGKHPIRLLREFSESDGDGSFCLTASRTQRVKKNRPH